MGHKRRRQFNIERVKHIIKSQGIHFKEIVFFIFNPYSQEVINAGFFIATSIYFAKFGVDLKWSTSGTFMFILYVATSALFTLINQSTTKSAKSYDSLKKLSTAIETLICLRTAKLREFDSNLNKKIINNATFDQSDLNIVMDAQGFIGLICKEVYNNIECKYSYTESQIVLFQQFKDQNGSFYVSPVSYGTEGDNPPNCMGKKFYVEGKYSEYSIVKMFTEPKSSYIILSDPESIKGVFKYIPEDACSNENIKQYLAIPIRNRVGVLTAVLQIAFYHIILPNKNDDIEQYIKKCIEPFLRFIDLVYEEHHVIETYNKCIVGFEEKGVKSEGKGDE